MEDFILLNVSALQIILKVEVLVNHVNLIIIITPFGNNVLNVILNASSVRKQALIVQNA